MKSNITLTILGAMLTGYAVNSNAQANQSLSNLTSPTAVNQNLLPNTTNTNNLGSDIETWKDIYFGGSIYRGGSRAIDFNGSSTALGINTLSFNTGSYNTATGNWALYANTTGLNNTASGYYALRANTTGSYNTATGSSVLRYNTTGSYNTASGFYALRFNTTGSYNTADGYYALGDNTAGTNNTAIGYNALNNNTTGSSNTAIGRNTLYDNSSGYSNVAIGVNALYKNTTQSNIVAVGDSALHNNVSGSSNTAVGSKALYSNTTGFSNTAVGSKALYSNAGHSNTADGYSALYSNTVGYFNTANGLNALYYNTSGTSNSANGVNALYYNTTGSNNTATGLNALLSNITGDYNTATGRIAGSRNDNNTYCSFFGYNADQTLTTDFTNSMALGNGSRITASNQVRIGNSTVTSIGGYANWSNISDGRVKKNVKEDVPGLPFIIKLKPVTYNLNVTSIRNFLKEDAGIEQNENESKSISNENNTLIEKGIKEKEKIVYTGFVAQEVEKAAKEIGYDFSGVDAPKDENDYYGLRYAEFVVPLVKAVQELSKQNDELGIMNDELKKKDEQQQTHIDDLESRLAKLESLMNGNQSIISDHSSVNHQRVTMNEKPETAKLEQNIPNPFNYTTTINYTLPETYTSAKIIITDKSGKVLKEVNVSNSSPLGGRWKGAGKGSIKIDASTLSSGAYQYSLYVNGKLFGSKQMIVVK